mmetsp:Transcript_93646/g.209236  ORF Transcript_93646/g.209236 Transcript_93646/m.209236 type:complete len:283 (-) Transcript_93646:38-886(-)
MISPHSRWDQDGPRRLALLFAPLLLARLAQMAKLALDAVVATSLEDEGAGLAHAEKMALGAQGRQLGRAQEIELLAGRRLRRHRRRRPSSAAQGRLSQAVTTTTVVVVELPIGVHRAAHLPGRRAQHWEIGALHGKELARIVEGVSALRSLQERQHTAQDHLSELPLLQLLAHLAIVLVIRRRSRGFCCLRCGLCRPNRRGPNIRTPAQGLQANACRTERPFAAGNPGTLHLCGPLVLQARARPGGTAAHGSEDRRGPLGCHRQLRFTHRLQCVEPGGRLFK